MEFGEYKPIEIRKQWKTEDKNFTPWLRDHIQYLNESLNLELTPQGSEEAAGSFSIDILAQNKVGDTVIIENQYGKTNHTHLGQILTYLAYHNAKIAIWICEETRPEHEKVINWLNENTDEDFYLVKLEVFSIDNSRPYPKFTKICGPSQEAKAIRKQKEGISEQQKIILDFWDLFLEKINRRFPEHAGNPSKNNFILRTAKKSGMGYSYTINKNNSTIAVYSDKKNNINFNIGRIEQLKKEKFDIEEKFGDKLIWDINPTRNFQAIRYNISGGGLGNREKWDEIQNNMIDSMMKFVSIMQNYVDKLN